MCKFQESFVPALNKNGFAKLTFKGLDEKSGVKSDKNKKGCEIIDPQTGKPKTTNWTIVNLKFVVMGRVRGTSQSVSINVGERYSEENLLGKALANMGFVPPSANLVTDDDGFEVEQFDEDEESFGQVEDDDKFDKVINDFLASKINEVFIAKISKENEGKRKGLWTVDVDSLRPLSK